MNGDISGARKRIQSGVTGSKSAPRIIPVFTPHLGCRTTCIYCNQKVSGGEPVEPSELVNYLSRAFKVNQGISPENLEVAFYGGDLLACAPEEAQRYISPVISYVKKKGAVKLRISTRPENLDDWRIDFLKKNGFATVEIGVQSTDPEVLQICRREPGISLQAIKKLKEKGFTVGVHLMYGLPGQNEESWGKTVDDVIRVRPDFVRLHPTLVFRDTELAGLFEKKIYIPMSLEEAVNRGARAFARFTLSNISVARTGLQVNEKFERNLVAGPHHPAFGELVESRIFLGAFLVLAGGGRSEGMINVCSPPSLLSRVRGHRSSNIEFLSGLGYDVTVKVDSRLDSNVIIFNGRILSKADILSTYLSTELSNKGGR